MAKYTLPPRQKMINLLYILLIAILAVNNLSIKIDNNIVSTDKINKANEILFQEIEKEAKNNPSALNVQILNNAKQVQVMSLNLLTLTNDIRSKIVKHADGKKYVKGKIASKTDTKSVKYIWNESGENQGNKLQSSIGKFKETVLPYVNSDVEEKLISGFLNTEKTEKPVFGTSSAWTKLSDDNVSVLESVTLISQIEGDILLGTNEVFQSLLKQIKAEEQADIPLIAFAIPNSTTIMAGNDLEVITGLSIQDTAYTQSVYIGNMKQPESGDGKIIVKCNVPGEQTINGYITHTNGLKSTQYPFQFTYNVVKPQAYIMPTLTSVLYAGYNNPIEINSTQLSNSALKATIDNGTVSYNNGRWTARPGGKSKKAQITLTDITDGKSQLIGTYSFNVKQIPDPTAYLRYKNDHGIPVIYKGFVPIEKDNLPKILDVGAKFEEDGMIANFDVESFETVCVSQGKNVVVTKSLGHKFSEEQKAAISKLGKGDKFYITSIIVVGPDREKRQIASIDAIVI